MATMMVELDSLPTENSTIIHRPSWQKTARAQLGKNIELLRSQIHYMTQRALAEAAGFGLSDCHISDLEKGSRSARSITIEQLRSIAQELGGRLIVQWQDETQKVRYNNKTPIGILFRKGATILILR